VTSETYGFMLHNMVYLCSIYMNIACDLCVSEISLGICVKLCVSVCADSQKMLKTCSIEFYTTLLHVCQTRKTQLKLIFMIIYAVLNILMDTIHQ
jgi:hypothetical protein